MSRRRHQKQGQRSEQLGHASDRVACPDQRGLRRTVHVQTQRLFQSTLPSLLISTPNLHILDTLLELPATLPLACELLPQLISLRERRLERLLCHLFVKESELSRFSELDESCGRSGDRGRLRFGLIASISEVGRGWTHECPQLFELGRQLRDTHCPGQLRPLAQGSRYLCSSPTLVPVPQHQPSSVPLLGASPGRPGGATRGSEASQAVPRESSSVPSARRQWRLGRVESYSFSECPRICPLERVRVGNLALPFCEEELTLLELHLTIEHRLLS